ncbi:hypothetical protein HDU80_002592, partial [Chytriomyces hyalinus]
HGNLFRVYQPGDKAIDFLKDLEGIKSNVLVVSGEADWFTDSARHTNPEHARELLPNAASIQTNVLSNLLFLLRENSIFTSILATKAHAKKPLSPDFLCIVNASMATYVANGNAGDRK